MAALQRKSNHTSASYAPSLFEGQHAANRTDRQPMEPVGVLLMSLWSCAALCPNAATRSPFAARARFFAFCSVVICEAHTTS